MSMIEQVLIATIILGLVVGAGWVSWSWDEDH